MYKSIVFDLGGVMVDFAPRAYLVDRICNEEIGNLPFHQAASLSDECIIAADAEKVKNIFSKWQTFFSAPFDPYAGCNSILENSSAAVVS